MTQVKNHRRRSSGTVSQAETLQRRCCFRRLAKRICVHVRVYARIYVRICSHIRVYTRMSAYMVAYVRIHVYVKQQRRCSVSAWDTVPLERRR